MHPIWPNCRALRQVWRERHSAAYASSAPLILNLPRAREYHTAVLNLAITKSNTLILYYQHSQTKIDKQILKSKKIAQTEAGFLLQPQARVQ